MASLLRTKRFGWGVIFVLFTMMALSSYFSSQRYLAATRAVEHSQAVESAIGGCLSLLKDAETGQRGYILTREPQFLEPYDSAKRDIPAFMARLERVAASDEFERHRLTELRELVEQKLAFIDETIRLSSRSEREAAVDLVRSGRGKRVMDSIRSLARRMLEREGGVLQQRKRAANDAERIAFWSVGIGSIATILLALLSLLTVQGDVQELKRTAEELAKSEEHYRLLTEQASDLVRLLTPMGVTTYVSPSVERLLGYTVAEFLALRPLSLMHPDETELGRDILLAVRDGKTDGGTSTYRLRHRAGHFLWFEVRWGVRRDERGQALEIHTASRDVTERREAEARLDAYAQELKSLSLRDELTGLYNRRGFLEVATQTHALAIREGRPAALLFVDLNGMKRINDELGHDQGDAALVDVAGVLRDTLRGCDTVARLGGDEFVAFVLDVTPKHVEGVRGRLRELADVRVAEQGRPFRLSMSLGAAHLPVGSRSSLEALLEEADQAMYSQKNARRAAGGVSVPPPAPG